MEEPRDHPDPRPVPTELTDAALAIALAERPSPRERAAVFGGRSLEEAVGVFRGRFGKPAPEVRERAAGWRRAAARAGRKLLILGTPAYPERLAEIAVPPIALEVAGAADWNAPAVAVVGARRASPYGVTVAEEISAGLAGAGITVVSGLARGVDAVAHRAALAAGGATIGVLGSSHDRLYPPEHHDLARRCAGAGAVATEFPEGTRPLPHHFPRRNRIIAGLALGTVVVEAAERSGSLSTARHAVESGREVFAVPGPIHSETSAGCHALIRQGAGLVRSLEDILEELGPLVPPAKPAGDSAGDGAAAAGSAPPPAADAPGGPAAPEDDAARLLRVLRAYPSGVDIDSLLSCCGLPVQAGLAAISELERQGRARRFPGDFLRSCD